jgi:hypothetical protein
MGRRGLFLRSQDFQIAANNAQQIVEIVGDAARQLPNSIELLVVQDEFFGALLLGEVIDDADEACFAADHSFAD